MEQLKRAAKITFRRLEDFFAEAKKRSIKQVFRNWGHKDEASSATYTGWDGGGVFIRGEIVFPELKGLMQSLPSKRYGHSSWEVAEGGRIKIAPDSKMNFIKTLQALGVGDEVKGFRKLTIESIKGLVNESTEEEDRETTYSRQGVLQRKIACNVIDGMIKELEVKIWVEDRRDANYHIYLGDWRMLARQLELRHEMCFREADIRVIAGEVELV